MHADGISFDNELPQLRSRSEILLPTRSGRNDSTISMSARNASGSRNPLMHRNPVNLGLVEQPDQWRWSSFRSYFHGERGLVRVNYQEWPIEIKLRSVETVTEQSSTQRPRAAFT
ncbi:MAG: hypothetical protein DMG80_11710 [Acidobacteria bacterium]|nr:MAG: hypothetical protein DMG80_11710 [Acidobacteriota bacterium]